jgi:hypothetical protein
VYYAREQLAFLPARKRAWMFGEAANRLFFSDKVQRCS